jgi:hypothetical protein
MTPVRASVLARTRRRRAGPQVMLRRPSGISVVWAAVARAASSLGVIPAVQPGDAELPHDLLPLRPLVRPVLRTAVRCMVQLL